MKIFNTFATLAFAHNNDQPHAHNVTVDLGNDIRLAACQGEAFKNEGMDVSSLVFDNSDTKNCPKEKAQSNVAKWDRNFSER